jgi:hypothetical protein
MHTLKALWQARKYIGIKENAMRWDLWNSLEYVHPSAVTKQVYESFVETVLPSVMKKHGDVRLYNSFVREKVRRVNKYRKMVESNIPRLSVCYLRTKTGTAVGLTYCNSHDNPNTWFGRALALKRAVRALKGRNKYRPHVVRTGNNLIRDETEFSALLLKYECLVSTKSFLVQGDPEYRLPLITGNGDNGNGK